MLETNECLEKLAAARVDFTAHGMLEGTALSEALEAMLEHAEEDLAEVEDEMGIDNDDPHKHNHGVRAPNGEYQAEQHLEEDGADDEDKQVNGALDGPHVDVFVVLAHCPGMPHFSLE